LPNGVKATSSTGYNWTFSQDEDWAGFGRVGYKFSPNWRVEAEYGYRNSDIKAVRGTGNSLGGQPFGLCTAGVAS
jgi:OOP family OmpA-OmpF porin